MNRNPDTDDVAGALYASVGLFVRRLRQAKSNGELTMSENSALAHLERGGPTTPTELAKLDRITPQSIGATLAGLEARGLVERKSDPEDGRRSVISLTETGLQMRQRRREARTGDLARTLSAEFTPAELQQLMEAAPLIERLAQRL